MPYHNVFLSGKEEVIRENTQLILLKKDSLVLEVMF